MAGAFMDVGLGASRRRADELADNYGERFRPTAYLRQLAAAGSGLGGSSARPTERGLGGQGSPDPGQHR
ncbi:hypothetical protein MF406_18310 (plasmid) [Georgenia sp. TF02-10]|uniref:hypothetical protein n=1 Tax=Georgenia sp. TF02-10 TaxID=2917725 RepID=UPI001FA7D39A|nr:hypothetical protein [Georgenia sp. TF02-10]UNX56600.1 hypothetical protein MF406_18310 [Georgenia sp. TF02-10]